MTSVSPISLLATYVRKRFDAERRSHRAADAQSQVSGGTPDESRSIVDVGLAGIDRGRADAPLMAFRVYVTAKISAELGPLDPRQAGLPGVLERVWHEMEGDAALSEAMSAAGRELLGRAARPE